VTVSASAGSGGIRPAVRRILAVSAFGRGRGGGHLVRSAALVRQLRSAGREAFLYLPDRTGSAALEPLLGDFDRSWIAADPRSGTWDLISLDCFRTSQEDYTAWSSLAPLIGIDEGGPCRDRFDFLIDTLPGPPGFVPANIASPALLPMPRKRREPAFVPRPADPKVLVALGAEDPTGLALPLVKILAGAGLTPTLVRGSLNSRTEPVEVPPGVMVAGGIPALGEHLAEYDLVITHFGLTAFECLYTGCPVLLVSPTDYHEALAKSAGFRSLGKGRRALKNMEAYIASGGVSGGEGLAALGERCKKLAEHFGLDAEQGQNSLGALIASFSPRFYRSCPVCGRAGGKTLGRFPDRTYRRCPRCGMVYMLRSAPPPVSYGEDYFFAAYKKQYGRTYLEDFPHLAAAGKKRLERILEYRRRHPCPWRRHQDPRRSLPEPSGKGRLLDIGCAYGPFLAAARDAGLSPMGIDASEGAVRYVAETLGIPAARGFFPDPSLALEDEAFDAVSLWYVIEHFEDPAGALGEINRILKPGGVLAFATPSFSGVSRKRSLRRFLEKSPPDHWTIWTPRYCGKILAEFGFTLKKRAVTGHHPERFPPFGEKAPKPVLGILNGISRLFRLGDTFEVYAVKKGAVKIRRDNG
jgi:SAM-dependent methyltransferase/spore coat polysaccharide biosynthesis predicted glycosyltransferase SpsG